MILIARGIICYGLHLFMVLLSVAIFDPDQVSQSPLNEIALGAGFIGFVLISRIEPVAEPLG